MCSQVVENDMRDFGSKWENACARVREVGETAVGSRWPTLHKQGK